MLSKGLLWNSTKNFKMQLLGVSIQEAESQYQEYVGQMGYQELIDNRRMS